MDLSNITPAAGSTHYDRRLGRGEGSGRGGRSTRGNKGAQSHSGYNNKRGFEGGQMPLQRRLPKFGFTNTKKIEYKAINIGLLETLATSAKLTEITPEEMYAAGLISRNDVVKVLAYGTLTTKINVKAHAFSASAKAAIEGLGGTVTTI